MPRARMKLGEHKTPWDTCGSALDRWNGQHGHSLTALCLHVVVLHCALDTTHNIPWLGPYLACEAWGNTVDNSPCVLLLKAARGHAGVSPMGGNLNVDRCAKLYPVPFAIRADFC